MTKHAARGGIGALAPAVLRRNADYRRAFLGSLTSSLGTAMSAIAFPLLVLALGGSAVQAGALATIALATRLAFRLPAGSLVDRWSRRTVALAADLVRTAALGSIPVAAAAGVLGYPQLVAVCVIEGLASALFGPAVSVLTRDVVSGDELAEALGLDQAVQATTYLIGPAIGGALYAVDRVLPFEADAASYAVSAVLLWRIALRPAAHTGRAEARGMAAGIRWLLSRRPLLNILMYASAVNLVSAAIEVMVVLDLRAHGEPGGQIGAVLSCCGVGAIAGSVLASRVVARLSAPAILLGIGTGWSVVLALFALSFSPWRVAALLLVLMTLSPAAGVVIGQALFGQCPRDLMGRVSAVTSILLSGLAALGPIVAGTLFQALGAAHGWLVLAGATAAVTLVAWVPLQASRTLPRIAGEADRATETETEKAHALEPGFAEAFPVPADEDLFEVVAHALPPRRTPSPESGLAVAPAADGLGFHRPYVRLPSSDLR